MSCLYLQIVFESVDGIRNVAAFGLEPLFFHRVKTLVRRPYKIALALSGLHGFTYGFSQSIIFFAYIITFRFGAFLVTVDSDSILFTEFENVYRVFAAIIFGALAIGAATAFAPDYSQAKLAAGTGGAGVWPATCTCMHVFMKCV